MEAFRLHLDQPLGQPPHRHRPPSHANSNQTAMRRDPARSRCRSLCSFGMLVRHARSICLADVAHQTMLLPDCIRFVCDLDCTDCAATILSIRKPLAAARQPPLKQERSSLKEETLKSWFKLGASCSPVRVLIILNFSPPPVRSCARTLRPWWSLSTNAQHQCSAPMLSADAHRQHSKCQHADSDAWSYGLAQCATG